MAITCGRCVNPADFHVHAKGCSVGERESILRGLIYAANPVTFLEGAQCAQTLEYVIYAGMNK